MFTISIEQIWKELERTLSRHRYWHSVGVAYTAASLAMCYGQDTDKALLSGALHDCAKHLSLEEGIKLCREHQVKVLEDEIKSPGLLHATTGMIVARERYGITDKEILDAIKNHTTGRPGMTMLEKIIYISDYIEPGRNFDAALDELRKLAYQDIDECLLQILHNCIVHIKNSGKPLDERTLITYDYYLKEKINGKNQS